MSGCCGEYRCRRAKPILIRCTPFSKRWVAVTDYSTVKDHPGIITSHQKHDVHDDLVAALIDAGWTPPAAVEQPEEETG